MIEVIGTDRFKAEIYDFTKDSEEWQFSENTPIILNFFATWCGPCHNFAPILQDISEEYGDKIKIYKMDIDASPEVAHLFGIRSVPSTVFLARNEEPALVAGGIGSEGLRRAIQELLGVDR